MTTTITEERIRRVTTTEAERICLLAQEHGIPLGFSDGDGEENPVFFVRSYISLQKVAE